jgi:hypothetical protein
MESLELSNSLEAYLSLISTKNCVKLLFVLFKKVTKRRRAHIRFLSQFGFSLFFEPYIMTGGGALSCTMSSVLYVYK